MARLQPLIFEHRLSDGQIVRVMVKRKSNRVPKLVVNKPAVSTLETDKEYLALCELISTTTMGEGLLTQGEIDAVVRQSEKGH
jgi:hypothetical protein